jgi:hypothetical protein
MIGRKKALTLVDRDKTAVQWGTQTTPLRGGALAGVDPTAHYSYCELKILWHGTFSMKEHVEIYISPHAVQNIVLSILFSQKNNTLKHFLQDKLQWRIFFLVFGIACAEIQSGIYLKSFNIEKITRSLRVLGLVMSMHDKVT